MKPKILCHKFSKYECHKSSHNMYMSTQTILLDSLNQNQVHKTSTHLSMSESLIFVVMALGCESPSLKTLSMTDNSVLVVSRPQKEVQSLTTMPPPMTSLPLFTVPAWEMVNTTIRNLYLFANITIYEMPCLSKYRSRIVKRVLGWHIGYSHYV